VARYLSSPARELPTIETNAQAQIIVASARPVYRRANNSFNRDGAWIQKALDNETNGILSCIQAVGIGTLWRGTRIMA